MNSDKRSFSSSAPIVCFFGASLHSGNMGVSALTQSLISIIDAIHPGALIYLLTGHYHGYESKIWTGTRYKIVQTVNSRLSLKSKYSEHLFGILTTAILWRLCPCKRGRSWLALRSSWINLIANASFIGDIWGGDSFSDIYGLPRLLIGSVNKLIAICLRKSYVFLPQTYGPFYSGVARLLASYLMNHAKVVFSRDKDGLAIAGKYLNPTNSGIRVRYCPDVAFVLPASKEEVLLSDGKPIGTLKATTVVGINVSGLMYLRMNSPLARDSYTLDYRSLIFSVVRMFLDEERVHVLFVPHSFGPPGSTGNDEGACTAILEQFVDDQERVSMVSGVHPASVLKRVIGLCSFFVGSRMHSCIAALSQSVPAVGIAYSRKFSGVFDTVGCSELVIEATTETNAEALSRIAMAYDARQGYAEMLRTNVGTVINEIESQFRTLFSKAGIEHQCP